VKRAIYGLNPRQAPWFDRQPLCAKDLVARTELKHLHGESARNNYILGGKAPQNSGLPSIVGCPSNKPMYDHQFALFEQSFFAPFCVALGYLFLRLSRRTNQTRRARNF